MRAYATFDDFDYAEKRRIRRRRRADAKKMHHTLPAEPLPKLFDVKLKFAEQPFWRRLLLRFAHIPARALFLNM